MRHANVGLIRFVWGEIMLKSLVVPFKVDLLCCMSPTKVSKTQQTTGECHPILIIYRVKAPLNLHPHYCYAAARSRPAGCCIIMNGYCLLVCAWY